MGIYGLYDLIRRRAPRAITRIDLKRYSGETIAVDANIVIYQFWAAGLANKITNRAGKYINHIQGLFFRTIAILEAGVTPIYIFDGIPPQMKEGTLAARRLVAGRVRVPSLAYTECKTLLRFMGVGYIDAPGEAEATAAVLCRNGHVAAVATEDSDALAFGAPLVLRGLHRAVITEISLGRVLTGLGVSAEGFIHLCILLGNDYVGRGLSPGEALEAVQRHGKITPELLCEISSCQPGEFAGALKEFTEPNVWTGQPAQPQAGPDSGQTAGDKPAASALPRLRPPDELLGEFLTGAGLDAKRIASGLARLEACMVAMGGKII